MEFVEAIRICFSKYFDFSGRARRSEYWWFYLFTILGGLVAGVLDGLLFGASELGVLGIVFSLGVLIPTIAAACRRLHDTNRSGWWQLLPLAGAIVMVAGFVGYATSGTSTIAIIGFILTLGLGILLLVWMATDSDAGDNRFGPNPKV